MLLYWENNIMICNQLNYCVNSSTIMLCQSTRLELLCFSLELLKLSSMKQDNVAASDWWLWVIILEGAETGLLWHGSISATSNSFLNYFYVFTSVCVCVCVAIYSLLCKTADVHCPVTLWILNSGCLFMNEGSKTNG